MVNLKDKEQDYFYDLYGEVGKETEGFEYKDVKKAVLQFEKTILETPHLSESVKNNIVNYHKSIFGDFTDK